MALAHCIIWKTKCWVYGGFLRDYVVGNSVHNDMDLDVGLEGTSASALMKKLDKVHGLQRVKHTQYTNPVISTQITVVQYLCFDGRTNISVEIVDVLTASQNDGKVDLDVNNLKVDT